MIIKKLNLKLEQAQNEVKDLRDENVGEKEDLLMQLRQTDVDVKFYRRVVENVMKTSEMAKLKSKSKWDDDINDWVIPPFDLKRREVALPSLSIKKQAQEYMEAQKEERDLVMGGESSDENGSSGQGSYL
jgi:hypothetical protein